jgi:hypothetical protein
MTEALLGLTFDDDHSGRRRSDGAIV